MGNCLLLRRRRLKEFPALYEEQGEDRESSLVVAYPRHGCAVRWEPWESNDPWRAGIKGSCRRPMPTGVYSSGSQTWSTQNLSLLASAWILQTPFNFITQYVSSFMSPRECFSARVLVLCLASCPPRILPPAPSPVPPETATLCFVFSPPPRCVFLILKPSIHK